ncbi:class II fructose-bisphosphate aldolase [Histidinibacterium lentulum]|uniref:Class II fructose-bisphosphate aldolase n=1 Tax=Histidinibacterium lentulum TaxID=2480588 RepID=A0A3N2R8G4_9RHOB|nr:class II fructose-bisphosphate aldolase [Histidinibacterium lentulum]ROU03708.1 class II fructose-bisphosphate aldolase [Histidinibacterium lentulum]
MKAALAPVLAEANARGHAVPGFVVQGWEDALAYTRAAEAEGLPLILQIGPGARAHTPLEVLAPMLAHLAETAPVPVVTHLDHSRDVDDCRRALDLGLSSLMFDGSHLPLAENVALTREVVRFAHASGVSVEGEVGTVGYAGGASSAPTDPEEARILAEETGLDALAVSVGNLHLQTGPEAHIDRAALSAIEAATAVPLVLHGGSGIPSAMRRSLAAGTRVAKFNLGTELRRTFGAALREGLARHPERFDRIEILTETIDPLTEAARRLLRELAPGDRPSV